MDVHALLKEGVDFIAKMDVDVATIVTATIVVFVKPAIRLYRNIRPCWQTRDVIGDACDGALLIPFFLIAFSAFAPGTLNHVIKSGGALVPLAGLCGFFYVIGEILEGGRTNRRI